MCLVLYLLKLARLCKVLTQGKQFGIFFRGNKQTPGADTSQPLHFYYFCNLKIRRFTIEPLVVATII